MGVCKTSDPLGRAIFDPRGFNLNNLGWGPIDKALYKISKTWLGLLVSEKTFKVFFYMSLCKKSDPWGRAIFYPKAIIRTNLVKGHKATYQISKAWTF